MNIGWPPSWHLPFSPPISPTCLPPGFLEWKKKEIEEYSPLYWVIHPIVHRVGVLCPSYSALCLTNVTSIHLRELKKKKKKLLTGNVWYHPATLEMASNDQSNLPMTKSWYFSWKLCSFLKPKPMVVICHKYSFIITGILMRLDPRTSCT